jgi:uncharacterized SAM-binding protein YcdF (DUF218 family)
MNHLKDIGLILVNPTTWIGLFLIVGVILLWTKRQKMARTLLTVGVSFFVLFSYDPLVEIFLNKLERKYPGFKIENVKAAESIRYVLVLAGGYVDTPETHPLSTKLGRSTNIRVIEGIKIHRELPGSKLVFTGKGFYSFTEAEAMKKFAISLGVAPDDIIIETKSTNTIDHTLYLKDILKGDRFVLVTSALHMPRAMGLFEKAGYHPIAAPTGHLLTGDYELFNMKVPFPTGDNLAAMDMVVMEFASTILAKIKGKL